MCTHLGVPVVVLQAYRAFLTGDDDLKDQLDNDMLSAFQVQETQAQPLSCSQSVVDCELICCSIGSHGALCDGP